MFAFYILSCISSSLTFSPRLPQLPLTAILGFSSSPALYCHSSSLSFTFPLPHGTTSVWEWCTCPVERDSDKQCDEKPGSRFTSLCLVSISMPTAEHRTCVHCLYELAKKLQKLCRGFFSYRLVIARKG